MNSGEEVRPYYTNTAHPKTRFSLVPSGRGRRPAKSGLVRWRKGENKSGCPRRR